MYVFQRALVKSQSQWQYRDVGDTAIALLYRQYDSIRLQVETSLGDFVEIDLNHPLLSDQLQMSSLSVVQWLTSIKDSTIPTSTITELSQCQHSQYASAQNAGYDIKATNITQHPDHINLVTDTRDLLLTREGVDYNHFNKHMLVSVNGIIHPISTGPYGVYILNGATTWERMQCFDVGLLSFEHVSQLQRIPITSDMIYHPNQSQCFYKEALYIQSEHTFKNHTVALVIGGYLHFLDDTYTLLSDHTLKIDMRRIALINRCLMTAYATDMYDPQTYHVEADTPWVSIDPEKLYTNDSITHLITSPWSFLVLFDTSGLWLSQKDLPATHIYGHYQLNDPIGGYVTNAHGQLVDYELKGRIEQNTDFLVNNAVTLATTQQRHRRYLYLTQPQNDPEIGLLDQSNYPAKPYQPQSIRHNLICTAP